MHPDDIPNPTDEQLRALDREVCFVPTETGDPKVLTPEQINHYNTFGYLMPFDGLGKDEVHDLRNFFEGALEAFQNMGRDSYSISTAHLRFARIHRLLSHPAILSHVSDLLGENLVGWGAHFFCKLPHDGKAVPWHQDAIYWPITPTRTVTVWLAIDDANPENANMRFIPRSHLHGSIDYQLKDDPNAVLNLETKDPLSYGDPPVDVTLKAGQFSMHCDLLLHGSEPNDSDRRRCGLTLRYAATEVKAYYDWHHKGVLVRGQDVSGNWANPPLPKQTRTTEA
jgi:non-heme Fe2+,alpha-ketoglutarate-dependent halogenase